MIILTRKLQIGLPVLSAVAFVTWAAVAYGIVGGFASLGALLLIGVTGLAVYVSAKMLRRLYRSPKGEHPKCGSTSALSLDNNGLKHGTCGKPAEAGLITEADKKLIMAHIDELFTKDKERSDKRSARERPITRADKKLIIAHIDELFVKDGEQTEEKYA